MEILIEIILQIICELGIETCLRGLGEIFEGRGGWFVTTMFYIFLGASIGGISLWLFPNHFLQDQSMRVANLIMTPVIAGWVMMKLGRWRRRRGQRTVRLDTFAYGLVFALSMATVRFVGCA